MVGRDIIEKCWVHGMVSKKTKNWMEEKRTLFQGREYSWMSHPPPLNWVRWGEIAHYYYKHSLVQFVLNLWRKQLIRMNWGDHRWNIAIGVAMEISLSSPSCSFPSTGDVIVIDTLWPFFCMAWPCGYEYHHYMHHSYEYHHLGTTADDGSGHGSSEVMQIQPLVSMKLQPWGKHLLICKKLENKQTNKSTLSITLSGARGG